MHLRRNSLIQQDEQGTERPAGSSAERWGPWGPQADEQLGRALPQRSREVILSLCSALEERVLCRRVSREGLQKYMRD